MMGDEDADARSYAQQDALDVALIDDHEIVEIALRTAFQSEPRARLVLSVRTVDDLIESGVSLDLVILDLRLADDSSPAQNVRRLTATGYRVLAFTSGEDSYLTRLAAQAGVLGVIRKSSPVSALIDAIEHAGRGLPVMTTEWAHAVESDPGTAEAKLSPQETRILTLFADGAKAQSVASQLNITVGTLEDYVRRIRAKYARVGRPAYTKVDLYKRAVEDGLLPGPRRE